MVLELELEGESRSEVSRRGKERTLAPAESKLYPVFTGEVSLRWVKVATICHTRNKTQVTRIKMKCWKIYAASRARNNSWTLVITKQKTTDLV